ncbi:hypothetical protein U1Q18_050367 [Sarracenia purpurea var. burkii]
MPKIESKRFILHENPGTLQNLASIAVAAELWREEITQCGAHDRPLNYVFSVLESQSKMPIAVAKLIDKCIEPVRKSIYYWLKSEFLHVFLPYVGEYDIFRKYADCIAWRADCSIDCEQTAEKMIACAEMSISFKYKLACTYCLEDHVRRLFPNLSSFDHILDDVLLKTNPVILYWQCRMTCTCNEDHSTIDMEKFERIKPENWSAWKYCWSRLSPKDQIDEAVKLIKSTGESRHSIKYLLASLTNSQLVKVMKRCSQRIMIVLARTPEDVKYALQIWHIMKNTISGKNYVEMFEAILDERLDVNLELLEDYVKSITQCHARTKIKDSELVNVNVSGLLYDIWQSSPDRLKTHLFNEHIGEILAKLSKRDKFSSQKLSRDVRLMIELLSRRNHLVNNTFWRKHWTDLINGVSAANLDQIIDYVSVTIKKSLSSRRPT